MTCNNCGKPKETEKFKACSKCRSYWRNQQRNPNGALAQLEILKKEIKRLSEENRRLRLLS